MYKHYIKIDENDMVTDAFSSAFRQPEGGEILIAETHERHFNLELRDRQGILQYQWNMNRFDSELQALQRIDNEGTK